MNKSYKVKLDAFEGPLDLLLHLINRMEIDIYDIPVADMTDQYMHYIHTMQQIELDVASEYLVMAATLLEMKSSMLLPNQTITEQEEEWEEDPRDLLLEKLLEYRKFKVAAEDLKEKELEENQLYVRPKKMLEMPSDPTMVTEKSDSVSVFDLLDALHHFVERKKEAAPITSTVKRVDISVEDRKKEILAMLSAEQTIFTALFPYHDRQHIVVTFLAVLQLLKSNDIYCEQKAQFAPIFVSKVEI